MPDFRKSCSSEPEHLPTPLVRMSPLRVATGEVYPDDDRIREKGLEGDTHPETGSTVIYQLSNNHAQQYIASYCFYSGAE